MALEDAMEYTAKKVEESTENTKKMKEKMEEEKEKEIGEKPAT